MSGLLYCGWCCMLLSIWAILQLTIMGIFFKFEVLAFIEEAEAHHDEYDSYTEFIDKTKENYNVIAINCWVASAVYLLCMGLSLYCIKKAKLKMLGNLKIKTDEDFCDELVMAPKPRSKNVD